MTCLNKCDNGLLFKRHKVTCARYLFKCDCFLGSNYTYPQWKSIDAVDYENEFNKEVMEAGNLEGAKILYSRFGAKKLEEPDLDREAEQEAPF